MLHQVLVWFLLNIQNKPERRHKLTKLQSLGDHSYEKMHVSMADFVADFAADFLPDFAADFLADSSADILVDFSSRFCDGFFGRCFGGCFRASCLESSADFS